MIGSIRWNIGLGVSGFVLTFVLSAGNNFLGLTLLRSMYSFIIVFALGFLIRWILGTVAKLPSQRERMESAGPSDEEHRGQNIDLVTPADEHSLNPKPLHSLDPSGEEKKFSPLNPPKLAHMDRPTPEDLAKAVRHMSEGEGR